MHITGIGQTILELLGFEVGSGNHQRGISLLQIFSKIFGNVRLLSLKMTSHLTSHNFQSKQCLGCLAVDKIYVAGYS